MKTTVKALLSFILFLSLLGAPFVLNIAGIISVGVALAGFMAIFGGTLMFGAVYAAYKFIIDASQSTVSSEGTLNLSSKNSGLGQILNDINQELKGMEGRDQIDTMYGEELRYRKKVFYDQNQKAHVFYGVVGLKKKKPKKVVVIYSPTTEVDNTKVWNYTDDPNWEMRQNPLNDFEPFQKGKGMYKREDDRRKGGSSGDISIEFNEDEGEYEDF